MTSKDIALQNSNGSPNVGAGSPNRGVVSRYGGAWCGIRRDPAEFNPELVNSRPQYRQCCGNVCMRDFTNCELFSILRENLNIAFATDGSLWQNLYFHSSECAYHGETHISASKQWNGFYRSTLVSTVLAVCRCLSVRLSRSSIVSRRLKISSSILSRPGSPVILVFDSMRRYPIPRGIPSAVAQNTRGMGNICDFRLKSPFISETVRDRPMLTMELL